MYKAILIGFQYTNQLKLPGIENDLNRIYHFCKRGGASIYLLTDIPKSKFNLEEIDFCTHISDKAHMEQVLESIFVEGYHENFFVYFSGHGEVNGFILPNEDIFRFLTLRNLIMNLDPKSEIVWVNDCCHVSGLDLPFKLNHQGNYESCKGLFCPIQKLLYLGSSEENEKSLVSKEGSVFTNLLFRKLETEPDIRKLFQIINQKLTKLKQTRIIQPCIFSSDETIFTFYPWVYGKQY